MQQQKKRSSNCNNNSATTTAVEATATQLLLNPTPPLPRLLVDPLVAPAIPVVPSVSVQLPEPVGHPVVLPDEQRVQDGQRGLLVGSSVPREEAVGLALAVARAHSLVRQEVAAEGGIPEIILKH